MGFIDLPDPISIFEGAATAKLEREIANSMVSAAYSAWISAMWRSGSAKWVVITGEGQALKDAATAVYLSLRDLERKGFLTLTVPKDLLDADNLSRFQTESVEKKT
jgi:hypothetical protein